MRVRQVGRSLPSSTGMHSGSRFRQRALTKGLTESAQDIQGADDADKFTISIHVRDARSLFIKCGTDPSFDIA
jgi:hypothetical protein